MDGQVLIAASCIVAFLSYRYKARSGRPRKGSPASGFFANMGDQSPMPPSRGPESSGPHLFLEKPTFFALAAAFAFPLRRDVVC